MNPRTIPSPELENLAAFYGATLKAAVKEGKGLKDLETREAWEAYKALLAEKARRVRDALLRPGLYN